MLFLDYLSGVKKIVLSSFNHGNTPFDLVVSKINPVRSLNTNPLFQLMFTYETECVELKTINGASINTRLLETETSHFDLTFSQTEKNGRSCIRVEYCTHLFPNPTIPALIIKAYISALEEISTDEKLFLWQIPILNSEDKAAVLNSINNNIQLDETRI